MKQNKPEDDTVFTTYDLGLSAALLASGYKLQELDRSNRRAMFMFENKSGIDVSANKFYADELRVKARSYFDSLKALKVNFTLVNNQTRVSLNNTDNNENAYGYSYSQSVWSKEV